MSKLPSLNARKIIKALLKVGFKKHRQKGSHLILINRNSDALTVVPVHPGRTIRKSLLHSIIKEAKLSSDEFLKLL